LIHCYSAYNKKKTKRFYLLVLRLLQYQPPFIVVTIPDKKCTFPNKKCTCKHRFSSPGWRTFNPDRITEIAANKIARLWLLACPLLKLHKAGTLLAYYLTPNVFITQMNTSKEVIPQIRHNHLAHKKDRSSFLCGFLYVFKTFLPIFDQSCTGGLRGDPPVGEFDLYLARVTASFLK